MGAIIDLTDEEKADFIKRIDEAMADFVNALPGTESCRQGVKVECERAAQGDEASIQSLDLLISAALNGDAISQNMLDVAFDDLVTANIMPPLALLKYVAKAKNLPSRSHIAGWRNLYVTNKGIPRLFLGQTFSSVCEEIAAEGVPVYVDGRVEIKPFVDEKTVRNILKPYRDKLLKSQSEN